MSGKIGGSSGPWKSVDSGSLSSQASLDIDVTATTKVRLNLTGNGVDIGVRTSTDGGSSYDSGASDYSFGLLKITGNGAISAQGEANDAEFVASKGSADTQLEITIVNPASSVGTSIQAIAATATSGAGILCVSGGGRVADAAVNAVRILPASGTLTGTYEIEERG